MYYRRPIRGAGKGLTSGGSLDVPVALVSVLVDDEGVDGDGLAHPLQVVQPEKLDQLISGFVGSRLGRKKEAKTFLIKCFGRNETFLLVRFFFFIINFERKSGEKNVS